MGKIFFLRKNKSFNKNKYSRNRQSSRVIFYFGLCINILIIYGAFIILYGFTLKFSYNIWLFYLLISSFIIPSFFRVFKRVW